MVKDNDVNQRVVHLSIDEIAEALDNCTFDTRYIIDLQEEEIIRLSEYMMSSEEIQEVFDEIDDDETGRYVLFPIRMGSRDGHADMELFIEEIKNPEVQELANQVIRGPKPFRRFKEILSRSSSADSVISISNGVITLELLDKGMKRSGFSLFYILFCSCK